MCVGFIWPSIGISTVSTAVNLHVLSVLFVQQRSDNYLFKEHANPLESVMFTELSLLRTPKQNFQNVSFCDCITIQIRSQWPRGLRHELSSPAQTLGSWVWIPLEAWMCVCAYSVFVLYR
jgi:hypothetical protein